MEKEFILCGIGIEFLSHVHKISKSDYLLRHFRLPLSLSPSLSLSLSPSFRLYEITLFQLEVFSWNLVFVFREFIEKIQSFIKNLQGTQNLTGYSKPDNVPQT
jgi:hypothetical protein